ncbi:MAG: hypothetical protein JNK15_01060 [Planctomycetes bacterium]|nr:hypothetical protein [Planctomycetota bacterium]
MTRLRHPAWFATPLIALTACGSGGGTGSNATTDTIAPQAGEVRDGLGADAATQTSTSTFSANWSGFQDDSGAIAEYHWALGTTPGGTEIQGWQSVGTATSATNPQLALSDDTTVYASVRAFDAAGNQSSVASSNGSQIDVPSGGGGGGGGGSQTLASSVTQWGVTWQFAEPEQVGQFCNGDWWVVGPVDVVSISPPTQNVAGRQINGSMVNPTTLVNGEHGYDSQLYHPYEADRYKSYLNVAIGVSSNAPLQLTAGKSLISAISYLGTSLPPNGSFSQLQTAAVLTVLASAPAADAFRPPYTGNDKTVHFRESDLDYTTLASLAPGSGMPDRTTTADSFQRVWLDHHCGWTSRYLHPIDNMPDYGRDFTSLYGTGVLMANTNLTNAQKRDLVVRLVQIGIDFHGNVVNGGYWEGVGGQGSGRKFPILFAGKLLGDSTMLAIGTSHPSGYYGPSHPNNRSQFGEDCQTFYVQQTSAGVYNWGYGGYTSTSNGLAEWGNNHTTWPSNDNSNWTGDPYRRCCTGNAWVGQTLTARIMGLVTTWNHPAYFDYMDRFMQTEAVGQWTRSWDTWQASMWDTYRSSL